MDKERRKIARKYIQAVELAGGETLELKIGQRVLDTKIINEAVLTPSVAWRTVRAMPAHKVVVVLECVEFEGYDYGNNTAQA